MSAFRRVQDGDELLVDGGQRTGALLQRNRPDLSELVGVVGQAMGSSEGGVGSRRRGHRRLGGHPQQWLDACRFVLVSPSLNANIGAARAAFFPTISLTATTGRSSDSLSSLFDGGRGTWTFMPSISVPIFNAGSLKGSLDSAKIAGAIEVANYEKAIQTAFSEVSDALANRRGLIEQLDAQKSLVKTEGERLELANLRYRSGVSSYFDVLDAQRSHFTAQQSLISARAEQRQNLVELYKVLGGGWK